MSNPTQPRLEISGSFWLQVFFKFTLYSVYKLLLVYESLFRGLNPTKSKPIPNQNHTNHNPNPTQTKQKQIRQKKPPKTKASVRSRWHKVIEYGFRTISRVISSKLAQYSRTMKHPFSWVPEGINKYFWQKAGMTFCHSYSYSVVGFPP